MSQELSDKEINNGFKKLKITPETESFITENTDNLDNALKTITLDSIDRFQGKRSAQTKIKISYPKLWLQILMQIFFHLIVTSKTFLIM